MKRKLSFLFLSALTVPFFMGSCSDDKEEQEVKPATDLVVDNNSVTLLQGDEITVSITSGNGDYYVKPFDENVATATINGNKVTIKATENSQLEENNRTETTILIVDGRKKVARVLVRVAKLWDLTVDAPEEGFDLFIGEKRLVKILTGNGDYQISIPVMARPKRSSPSRQRITSAYLVPSPANSMRRSLLNSVSRSIPHAPSSSRFIRCIFTRSLSLLME